MRTLKISLTLMLLAGFCLPAMARQSEDELEERMQEAEMRLTEEETRELERSVELLAVEAMEVARQAGSDAEDIEVRMREAEVRMAEAARQVAELSTRRLPRVEHIERIIRADRGPVLGITIGAPAAGEPVEGVEIMGVTPGGAAAESGLRAGDVITSVNGEALNADGARKAAEKLLEFMSAVEDGDELEIEYLRNGKSESVALVPKRVENRVFAYQFDTDDFAGPNIEMHVAPKVQGLRNGFAWTMHDDGFGGMELVTLTDGLGTYFGTSEGLLVVRAPGSKELKLEDGDVILNIDGRTPNSVSHAMRILGSYQAGEELKIEIMRDKKKRTIEIEIPDNRQSWVRPSEVPPVAEAPRIPVAPRPVIVTSEERI
jgi:type II secretory pathway component PulC